MFRLVLIVALLFVLYLLIRSAVREIRSKSHPQVPARDQMIQDPVCHVYVPRASAVGAVVGGQHYFFCSQDCAKRFEARLRSGV
jgi:YHS domain-containing protein